MSISSYAFTPLGNFVRVMVTSTLSGPTVFWYVDGVFLESTNDLEVTIYLPDAEFAEVVAIDSTSPLTFDIAGNAPASFPAHHTLWWTRSTDADVESYRVRQQIAAAGLVTIADVSADDSWAYSVKSPRLLDLTQHDWEVVPIDASGNLGAALVIGPVTVVRRPDPTDFVIAFSSGTSRVTYSAA